MVPSSQTSGYITGTHTTLSVDGNLAINESFDTNLGIEEEIESEWIIGSEPFQVRSMRSEYPTQLEVRTGF